MISNRPFLLPSRNPNTDNHIVSQQSRSISMLVTGPPKTKTKKYKPIAYPNGETKTTRREIVAQKNQCNVNRPKTKSYGQDPSVSRKDDERKTENPHFKETLEQNNEFLRI
jgi:hypothetical protein